MAQILLTGCASLIALLFGIRVYCIYFVWGQCKVKTSLKGKTVIITGANSGIGRETAKELAKCGAKVIMGCRDERSALSTIEYINSNVKHNGNLIYKHIDLTSFASVKQFANDIIKNESSINILINNAGVFGCPFSVTEDGYETQMQVNHLSHALLTMLLTPKLEESARKLVNDPSRVIMVTSSLYKRGTIIDDNFKKGSAKLENYDKFKAYSDSKLSNILFSKELSQKLYRIKSPIDLYIVSPGMVWTKLNRHTSLSWWKMILLSPLGLLLLRTPYQGCQTLVHCALSQSLTSGKFYRNCKEQSLNTVANDPNLAMRVYDMTVDIIEKEPS